MYCLQVYHDCFRMHSSALLLSVLMVSSCQKNIEGNEQPTVIVDSVFEWQTRPDPTVTLFITKLLKNTVIATFFSFLLFSECSLARPALKKGAGALLLSMSAVFIKFLVTCSSGECIRSFLDLLCVVETCYQSVFQGCKEESLNVSTGFVLLMCCVVPCGCVETVTACLRVSSFFFTIETRRYVFRVNNSLVYDFPRTNTPETSEYELLLAWCVCPRYQGTRRHLYVLLLALNVCFWCQNSGRHIQMLVLRSLLCLFLVTRYTWRHTYELVIARYVCGFWQYAVMYLRWERKLTFETSQARRLSYLTIRNNNNNDDNSSISLCCIYGQEVEYK